MFGLFEPTHLLVVLVVALVVFRPARLIEMSRDLGRFVGKLNEHKEELKEGLLGTSREENETEKSSPEGAFGRTMRANVADPGREESPGREDDGKKHEGEGG